MDKHKTKEIDLLRQCIIEKEMLEESYRVIFKNVDLTEIVKIFVSLFGEMTFHKRKWSCKYVGKNPFEVLKGYILIEGRYIEVYCYEYKYKLRVVEESNVDKEVSSIEWDMFLAWIREYYTQLEDGLKLFKEFDVKELGYHANPGGYYIPQFEVSKTKEDQKFIINTLRKINSFLSNLSRECDGRFTDGDYTTFLIMSCFKIKGCTYLEIQESHVYMQTTDSYFIPIKEKDLHDIPMFVEERFNKKGNMFFRYEGDRQIESIDIEKVLEKIRIEFI